MHKVLLSLCYTSYISNKIYEALFKAKDLQKAIFDLNAFMSFAR